MLLLAVRCAQITPLTGGQKDATPPKPLHFSQPNASTNFKEKFIEIEFDEFISLKDVANQLIVTPQIKQIPTIQLHGKKLRIEFNDTLASNTTYKLAFGNSISDLNESNVLRNFEYVFSTGTVLDSLTINGQILNSTNKKPVSQVSIGLYDIHANDSIVYKNKPLYVSTTNEDGKFTFGYLPNKTFKIVGIKDDNHNWLYDGSEEQIAFSNAPINPINSPSVGLTLFSELPNKLFVKKSFSSEYGKALIIYNRPTSAIKSLKGQGVIDYLQHKRKDTLSIFYDKKFDTLKVVVQYESHAADTLMVRIPSESFFVDQFKRKKITYNLKPDFGKIVPFFDKPGFALNMPIPSSKINYSKMYLFEQHDTIVTKIPFTILSDKNLTTAFKINTVLKPETNYTLSIGAFALLDDDQRANDSIAFSFKTNTSDDYAKLNMKLLFPKKEHYIVMLFNDKDQLVNEKTITFSLTSTSEKSIQYEHLIPGSYFVRVIEDANKNAVFDTGDYFLQKQPECIYIRSAPIQLMAGWEIETEWLVE